MVGSSNGSAGAGTWGAIFVEGQKGIFSVNAGWITHGEKSQPQCRRRPLN
jgi:hypothetical protein